ncbi:MAG: glycoside hydrolase family 3 C-terminal domain-containing protein [Bacteroidales bacterium]|nr:glycoside hydrolase family 3 C-terminal domain-containing protein [Bacteroidales bacterium]
MSLALMISCGTNKTKDFEIIVNKDGATLGYSPASGVKILKKDGLSFKDLNKNGRLDAYEDWRLSVDERARDLAARMSVEQIAGLMLYSGHQSVPSPVEGFTSGLYNGLPFPESGANVWDLNDEQKAFLKNDNVRHVLVTSVQSPAAAARWNNAMQSYAESIGLGIPCNTSSDPRHSENVNAEFNAGSGGEISVWPDGLAMAATFDPQTVRQFGEIASQEYRALGIGTALSPQIDLGTEPRWFRIGQTFGESPELSTDMARAYTDGFQTSEGKYEIRDGWGYHSVNAMIKHWPGGGAVESGRDAHWAFGKFAVYPGNNFAMHQRPFVEGALKLDGKTQKAAAVMPYYTISYGQATDSTNYGNGFSSYMINHLLRGQYGYDGVVCTDWAITWNEGQMPEVFDGKPWGVESLSIAQRHYMTLMAGVDQFGGNNEMAPVIEAYQIGVDKHGEVFMRNRFEQSAIRLLRNIFRIGLFENPYLDPEESARIVGNPNFMKAGYDAQIKSVVMLKNKRHLLPVKERKTVYIPRIFFPTVLGWWGDASESRTDYPINLDIVKKYYNVTDDPQKADFAIVFVSSPHAHADGGGYDKNDREAGGNGYVPITLQYLPYKATDARAHSIAAGDPVIAPSVTNRSYKKKSYTALNTKDLNAILDTKSAMKGKPTVVVVNATRPMVFNEFEKAADGIIIHFGVNNQAVMDIISGKYEPSGLLPLQMPANMSTVEKQYEDMPFDMKCHKDSEGNIYDFAFGLNWNGVIHDTRTEKYKKN